MADHPLGPATDHRLRKLLPHQLANQTRAPPWADFSFCSSAYGVLATVSSCCSPPKGRFLRVTHSFTTGNTTSFFYRRLFLGGRHPLCGIGVSVTSRIQLNRTPLVAMARNATSLPLPAPFTITSARCKPTVRIASTAVLYSWLILATCAKAAASRRAFTRS